MPRAAERFLARRYIPDLDGSIRACGGEVLTTGVEGHAEDTGLVAAKGLDLLAGLHVEQSYRPVLVGGGEAPAVGTEGRAVDSFAAASEDSRLDQAEPLEVVPFPLPQSRRTRVEQFLGTA